MRIGLDCGNKPAASFVHHRRWKRPPHLDTAHELEAAGAPPVDRKIELIPHCASGNHPFQGFCCLTLVSGLPTCLGVN